jgi:hypothetical protein
VASLGKKIMRLPSQPRAGGARLSSQAIWETEVGMITVSGQCRQKSLQDPISMEKAGPGGVCLSSQRCRKHKTGNHGSDQCGQKITRAKGLEAWLKCRIPT